MGNFKKTSSDLPEHIDCGSSSSTPESCNISITARVRLPEAASTPLKAAIETPQPVCSFWQDVKEATGTRKHNENDFSSTGDYVRDRSCLQQMRAAGYEEAALAIQAGDVDDDGIPVIAGVTDGIGAEDHTEPTITSYLECYTQHDVKTARQFYVLREEANGHLKRSSASQLRPQSPRQQRAWALEAKSYTNTIQVHIQRTVWKDFQSKGLLVNTSNPEDYKERLPSKHKLKENKSLDDGNVCKCHVVKKVNGHFKEQLKFSIWLGKTQREESELSGRGQLRDSLTFLHSQSAIQPSPVNQMANFSPEATQRSRYRRSLQAGELRAVVDVGSREFLGVLQFCRLRFHRYSIYIPLQFMIEDGSDRLRYSAHVSNIDSHNVGRTEKIRTCFVTSANVKELIWQVRMNSEPVAKLLKKKDSIMHNILKNALNSRHETSNYTIGLEDRKYASASHPRYQLLQLLVADKVQGASGRNFRAPSVTYDNPESETSEYLLSRAENCRARPSLGEDPPVPQYAHPPHLNILYQDDHNHATLNELLSYSNEEAFVMVMVLGECRQNHRHAERVYEGRVSLVDGLGEGGPVTWPTRSPDLTPLIIFLGGRIKDTVYQQCPTPRDEMKERIRVTCRSLPAAEIFRDTAVSSLSNNLQGTYQQYTIDTLILRGYHFPYGVALKNGISIVKSHNISGYTFVTTILVPLSRHLYDAEWAGSSNVVQKSSCWCTKLRIRGINRHPWAKSTYYYRSEIAVAIPRIKTPHASKIAPLVNHVSERRSPINAWLPTCQLAAQPTGNISQYACSQSDTRTFPQRGTVNQVIGIRALQRNSSAMSHVCAIILCGATRREGASTSEAPDDTGEAPDNTSEAPDDTVITSSELSGTFIAPKKIMRWVLYTVTLLMSQRMATFIDGLGKWGRLEVRMSLVRHVGVSRRDPSWWLEESEYARRGVDSRGVGVCETWSRVEVRMSLVCQVGVSRPDPSWWLEESEYARRGVESRGVGVCETWSRVEVRMSLVRHVGVSRRDPSLWLEESEYARRGVESRGVGVCETWSRVEVRMSLVRHVGVSRPDPSLWLEESEHARFGVESRGVGACETWSRVEVRMSLVRQVGVSRPDPSLWLEESEYARHGVDSSTPNMASGPSARPPPEVAILHMVTGHQHGLAARHQHQPFMTVAGALAANIGSQPPFC
ncbi:hypothetical protein PR048_026692 [Dryococelus australis]|uniref:Uncharacterized protein n=1 Tax=Dryococelus australis TaxID=614101 RepID=A0ABQ9GM23_9NEOP|nr:hypothetical protein PR048_026692 [Dryococelus australis]